MAPKLYKYTYNNTYLTDRERDFYEENGYIVLPNLVPNKVLDECEQRFLDICHGKVDKGMMVIAKDTSLQSRGVKGEFVIHKIQEIIRDEVFSKYASCDPIVNVVESIIGPNITCAFSMLINKPPNAERDSSRHPIHQDYYYFAFKEVDSIVASWTAMERIDERNGCLFVVPGSHKGQLYKHDYSSNIKNKAYYEVADLEDVPKVNLIMEKGDTAFFHPLILHGSGPNLTQGFRRTLTCHYVDSNCHPLDVEGTDREKMANDVLDAVVKLGYPKITFDDFWKLKCVLIRGSSGNLQHFDSHL